MRHHRLLAEVLVLSKDSAPKAYKKIEIHKCLSFLYRQYTH
jgi:hypothetical protein